MEIKTVKEVVFDETDGTTAWWKEHKKALNDGKANILCAIATLESLKDITEEYQREYEYNDAIDFAVLVLTDKIKEIQNG